MKPMVDSNPRPALSERLLFFHLKTPTLLSRKRPENGPSSSKERVFISVDFPGQLSRSYPAFSREAILHLEKPINPAGLGLHGRRLRYCDAVHLRCDVDPSPV